MLLWAQANYWGKFQVTLSPLERSLFMSLELPSGITSFIPVSGQPQSKEDSFHFSKSYLVNSAYLPLDNTLLDCASLWGVHYELILSCSLTSGSSQRCMARLVSFLVKTRKISTSLSWLAALQKKLPSVGDRSWSFCHIDRMFPYHHFRFCENMSLLSCFCEDMSLLSCCLCMCLLKSMQSHKICQGHFTSKSFTCCLSAWTLLLEDEGLPQETNAFVRPYMTADVEFKFLVLTSYGDHPVGPEKHKQP